LSVNHNPAREGGELQHDECERSGKTSDCLGDRLAVRAGPQGVAFDLRHLVNVLSYRSRRAIMGGFKHGR
jgi:hypothetical protein